MHYAVCLSYLQVILFLDTIFIFYLFSSLKEKILSVKNGQ